MSCAKLFNIVKSLGNIFTKIKFNSGVNGNIKIKPTESGKRSIEIDVSAKLGAEMSSEPNAQEKKLISAPKKN